LPNKRAQGSAYVALLGNKVFLLKPSRDEKLNELQARLSV
jgi:hypothetical protein